MHLINNNLKHQDSRTGQHRSTSVLPTAKQHSKYPQQAKPAIESIFTCVLIALSTCIPLYAAAPEIIGHEGSDEVIIASPENQTVITRVHAIEFDGAALRYSISDGVDQQQFIIDPDSGELSFKVAPDFETPLDADKDNQYEVTVSVENAQQERASQAFTISISDDELVQLQLKAWLQGAYDGNTGMMRTDLINKGLIPLKQPYHRTHFGHYGGETLSDKVADANDGDAVVDWLLLELRDPEEPGHVLHTQAVILQSDGDIVDSTTGSTTLNFDLEQGSFVIGLRHRNHLGVMTAEPLTLSDASTLIDFGSKETAVSGDNGQTEANGLMMMWVGDLQYDKRIITQGPGNDVNSVFEGILTNTNNTGRNANFHFRGYNPLDLNLDGNVIFSGPGNDTTLLFFNTYRHPQNTETQGNFIVQGYLADTPETLAVTSEKSAARFLTQATFGPTTEGIAELIELGSYEAWIDQQFTQATTHHYPAHMSYLESTEKDNLSYGEFHAIWRNQTLYAPDQLRQRMGFALSQIMVVSLKGNGLSSARTGIAHYHDLLADNAFGNFRDLLEVMTLNPVMGRYLNMLKNRKADASRNIHPDENFAREIMQLFTIGLHQLNLDGTAKPDENGATIPTYTQQDIEGLAAVFTGWTFAGGEKFWSNTNDYVSPMVGWPDYHQTGDKQILDGHIINAESMEEELRQVLDILFEHPNVAPFISKQLIQRFVTSNPTPAYVKRISLVFENNGTGVRGDLGAVLKAILLDKEARFGHRTLAKFGKLKEPLIRQMAFWRALGGHPALEYGFYPPYHLNQGAYEAPSVFNFFRPDYQPPSSTEMGSMASPEMQIATEDQLTRSRNYALSASGTWNKTPEDDPIRVVIDLDADSILILDDPEALLERYNLLLMSGTMSDAMKKVLLRYLDKRKNQYDGKKLAARLLFLIMGSSQQAVQR